MEELATQKEAIKDYVLLLDSTIEDNDLLDFVIDSVVERALIYMNRLQLDGEEDSSYYWNVDDVPELLPVALERVLAGTVVGAYRNTSIIGSNTKEIASISDNGQTVHYSDKMADYLNGGDADIFSSTLQMLQRYRLPTIIADTSRF